MKPRFCLSWFTSLLLLLALFSTVALPSAQAQTAPKAVGMGVGSDNLTRLLWNNPDGSISLWCINADGTVTIFHYAQYLDFTALKLAVGSNNAPRMLWVKPDHSNNLLLNVQPDGNYTGGFFGTGYYPPSAGYSAIALAVDANNLACILWSRPADNTAILWRVNSDYSYSSSVTYTDPAGFTPTALAGGSDGKVRILWTKPDGMVQVWVINADGTVASPTTYSPYVNGLRLDAGSASAYTDSQSKHWAADYGATGGTTTTTGTAISGTSDPALYQTQRTGNSFSYSLSVPNGKYTLGLLFAETSGYTTGQRVFNVAANGTPLLTGFDIYAAAGGANKAITKSFPITVTTGQLNLVFTSTTGQAAVAGLSLTLPGDGTPSGDIPAPGWAEDVLPTDDASDADGDGPASAGSVNLASGVAENSPGPDLWAFNPMGPSASYARRYRSARATQGYASPGLSAGWTDGYDLFVTPGGNGYTLTYDNGGQEQWGGTTGNLTTPAGAPYLVNVSGGTLTMTFKDRSHYTFTQVTTAGGNYAAGTYLLTKITNLVGHAITLNRDTAANGYRMTSITNDAPTPLTLLSFTYDGNGKLSMLMDAYGRTITFGFTNGSLSSVSQINAASSPLWQYGYTSVQGVSLLSSVQAPDPSHPGNMATASTAYSNTGAVAYQQDAAGRVHSYSYGGSQTTVQVANVDGSLAQSWVQKQNAGLAGKNADTGTTDAAGKSSSLSYAGSPSPYLPSSATNRNNQTAQVMYNDNYGNVATVTSPRNVVTTYTYGNPADFPLNQVASVTQTHLTGGTQDDSKEPTSFTYYGPTDGVLNGLLHTVTSPRPDSTVANPALPSRRLTPTTASAMSPRPPAPTPTAR